MIPEEAQAFMIAGMCAVNKLISRGQYKPGQCPKARKIKKVKRRQQKHSRRSSRKH